MACVPRLHHPAEFAFSVAMLDSMAHQARMLEQMGEDLLEAAKQVGREG